MSATRPALLSGDHYMFDLRIRSAGNTESGSAWMPIRAEMRDDRGGMHAALLVVMVDGAAGRLAVHSALPRVVATSHISVRTSAPATGDAILAEASLLRRGRSAIAISIALSEHALAPGGDALADNGRGRLLGRGIATFHTIESAYDDSVVEALERGMLPTGGPDAGLTQPFFDAIGLRAVDPETGVFELPLSPYVQNHVSALQGGIFGALVETSAAAACRGALGHDVVVLDLSIPYLAMGTVGPFRTRARVVRATPEHAVAEVDVFDAGREGRLMTRATAVACARREPA